VESLYILYRVTGDVKWRHRGWDIFQAIEREAKTASGYANVDKVDTYHPEQRDVMPRFVPQRICLITLSHIVTAVIFWQKH